MTRPDEWDAADASIEEYLEALTRGRLGEPHVDADDRRKVFRSDDGSSPARQLSRFQNGGSAILDSSATAEVCWGRGSEVAWAKGEPIYVTGAIGIGKTTLIQRLCLHRIGVCEGDLLGYPVEPASGVALYLAADRPEQAMRSFRRMVAENDRERLDERLVVWKGPPAADLAKKPQMLTMMVADARATEVYLDSLKDMAVGLASDEVGAGLNISVQLAIAEGIQVVGAHHPRKKSQGTTARPRDLDDIYGSTWITGGAGSVIHLHGEPGALVSELIHLKSPRDRIGPFQIALDLDRGTVEVLEPADLIALAARADHGITAEDAARQLYGKSPDRSDIERARRRLNNTPGLESVDDPTSLSATPRKVWRPVTPPFTPDTVG